MALPRRLANWLRAYVHLTRHTEAPDHFHFFTGIATIAGALRRQVWIDQKFFRWYPNFYILLVAPAGVATKTTTIDVGRDILGQVPDIHFGPDSLTWPALLKTLAESKDLFLMPGSGEADQFMPMCPVTFFIGELGTVFDPTDTRMVDVLTSLWDNKIGNWWRSTKERGDTNIENPWVNIIAGTTPAWIADNFPPSAIGSGLTSRMLMLYAEKKRTLIAYPADQVTDADFTAQRQALVDDLLMIAQLFGAFEMTAAAKQWGKAWYEDLWTKRPDHLISARYDGYVSRKQTHLHKMAMVLAAAAGQQLIITEETLKQANAIVTSVENDMLRVFASIGKNGSHSHILEIMSSFRNSPRLPRLILWRHCMQMMDVRDFEAAILSMKMAGYVRDSIVDGQVGYELLSKR